MSSQNLIIVLKLFCGPMLAESSIANTMSDCEYGLKPEKKIKNKINSTLKQGISANSFMIAKPTNLT